jgi:hypothetical protein
VIIRYRVKPNQVEQDEERVRAVYEELHRAGSDLDARSFRPGHTRVERDPASRAAPGQDRAKR